jgi:uroporphyrin-III C-methyltransferase
MDRQRQGQITLVGAGPGDPELITLAGQRALAEADVVIYDRLVNPALLEHAPRADRIYIGKRPGESHEASQGRIDTLMLAAAREGKRVVRLKGGDPFVFGRGGEEVLAARREGVGVRVVPGVTAALGAAAAIQLPLTHRNAASSVAFVTGCSASEAPRPQVDWKALAKAVDTLVLYMGVRHLGAIARALIEGGRPETEPAAAIENATTSEQRIHYFTLAQLAAGEAEGAVSAPAIVVIGTVVRIQRELAAMAAEFVSCSRP